MWLTRRLRSRHNTAGASRYAVQDTPSELVTVRLPDGQLVQGERAQQRPVGNSAGGIAGNAQGLNPTAVLTGPPGGGRPGRRWYSWIPRWLRWTTLIVIVAVVLRRAVAWAVLAGLSGALHLFGANVHLPHVTFGWPWSSSSTTSSTTLV